MKIDETGDGGLAFEQALNVKLLDFRATPPSKAHSTDAGFDLFCLKGFRLDDRRKWISTGIAVDIPVGFQGRVTGKSGLSGKGVTVFTGTIDAGYHGEVRVLMEFHAADPDDDYPYYHFDAGDKIAQLIVEPIADLTHTVVVDRFKDEGETERGENGFGSTGK